jgi:hypothetical protein
MSIGRITRLSVALGGAEKETGVAVLVYPTKDGFAARLARPTGGFLDVAEYTSTTPNGAIDALEAFLTDEAQGLVKKLSSALEPDS